MPLARGRHTQETTTSSAASPAAGTQLGSLEYTGPAYMDQCVRCPDHQYANRERDHCLQNVVTFLAYEDPLGTALACTALSFSGLTAVVLGIFVKHRDTPTVKANNRTLSYILLTSLTLCFLCSLLFISHPNTATCILQQIAFGVVFTVAVSAVLAKTLTVLVAFKVTNKNGDFKSTIRYVSKAILDHPIPAEPSHIGLDQRTPQRCYDNAAS